MPPSSIFQSTVSAAGFNCPFLYHTRTILRRLQYSHARLSASTASNPRTPRPAKSFDDDQEPGTTAQSRSFLKQKAARAVSNKDRHASSITPAEQAAFDSMRAFFETPTPPSSAKARATSTDHADVHYKNILGLFSPSPRQPQEADFDVLDEAAAVEEDASSSHPVVQPVAESRANDVNATAAVDPEAQRKLKREKTMAQVQGIFRATSPSCPQYPSRSSSSSSSSSLSSTSNSTSDELQSTALRIVENVAESLTTALASQNPRPEIAIWKVAEEKVFPLTQLVGAASTCASTSSLSSSSSSMPTSLSATPPLPPSEPVDSPRPEPRRVHPLIPQSLPILPLLSQIYPSLTLLVLRLYSTYHPTSSYALALLPTLKSLGPTSYVLGAHTHFYNALLALYWRMYSDLRGMNHLLAEMDENGVEFDVGTWEVLEGVVEDRRADLALDGKGDGDGDGDGESENRRGRLWWERHEQRVGWFSVGIEWREVVRRRLEEKGLLPGEVMREHSMNLDQDADTEQSEYVVTL